MTASPAISIVIPNYNGSKLLQTCLNSIDQQSYLNFSVTVVDNGSSDGSIALIQQDYPKVHLIAFDHNRGFSSAVNEGIRQSETPWIFLLNNDTEIGQDCLESLIRSGETYPEIDFFAPKMINYFQRHLLDGAGDGVFIGGAGYRIGTMEEDCPEYNCFRPVFGACAGAAFYKKSFFDAVGCFDESFFAYLEDVDINLRAVRLGLKCLYVPDAQVYHMGSQTTGSRLNPFTVSHTTTNAIHVVVKNYPLAIILKKLPEIFIYHIWWFFVAAVNHQIAAYLKGLKQAIQKLPNMVKDRNCWKNHPSISEKELLDRIMASERDVFRSILRRRIQQGKSEWLIRLYMKVMNLNSTVKI